MGNKVFIQCEAMRWEQCSSWGNGVLDSFSMASGDEDSTLDQMCKQQKGSDLNFEDFNCL